MRKIINIFLLATTLSPGVVFAEDTSCIERVYSAERDGGADHHDAMQRAREVCDKSDSSGT